VITGLIAIQSLCEYFSSSCFIFIFPTPNGINISSFDAEVRLSTKVDIYSVVRRRRECIENCWQNHSSAY